MRDFHQGTLHLASVSTCPHWLYIWMSDFYAPRNKQEPWPLTSLHLEKLISPLICSQRLIPNKLNFWCNNPTSRNLTYCNDHKKYINTYIKEYSLQQGLYGLKEWKMVVLIIANRYLGLTVSLALLEVFTKALIWPVPHPDLRSGIIGSILQTGKRWHWKGAGVT